MLIKCDASQLEWRAKVFLSQDQVAMEEINKGYPIHDDNRERFGLPTRTIAKVFLYRAIFADCFGERGFSGPAFSYANDSDFMGCSTSAKFWEEVISKFFQKYEGVYKHSVGLIRTAIERGRVDSPSGRFYLYSCINGQWPNTQILNHIVQGISADFVMVARGLIKQRLQHFDPKLVLPINTIHDDVQLDVDNDPELCYNVCKMLEECFSQIPQQFEKNYGVAVNVPMAGEVKFGMSLYEPEMALFNPKTFEEDFNLICNSTLK